MYTNSSSQGNWVYKTSLFLNDTEIDLIEIEKIDEYFEIQGTYSISNFDMSNGKIILENSNFLINTTTLISSNVTYTISNGTDGMTWEASYANLY